MSEWPDVQLSFGVGGGRYLQPKISTQSWMPMQSDMPMRSDMPMQSDMPMRSDIPMQSYMPMQSELPAQSEMPVRRALVIGINYSFHPDPGFRLKHCVQDAYVMAKFLRDDLGFNSDDIRVMTDDHDPVTFKLPTKRNILQEMRKLVDGAQSNDSFFFYFSGHATQVKDLFGDEADGLHDCICALDYLGDDPYPVHNTPGLIVDDIMYDVMVKPLPSRCRLTALFDCPHFASPLELPYLYDSNGRAKPLGHSVALKDLFQKASYGDVVSLSASNDNQIVYETSLGGPLRRAFIDCIRRFGNTLTLKSLIKNICDYTMRDGFLPQLSSSHKIDADLPFIV